MWEDRCHPGTSVRRTAKSGQRPRCPWVEARTHSVGPPVQWDVTPQPSVGKAALTPAAAWASPEDITLRHVSQHRRTHSVGASYMRGPEGSGG